MSKSVNEKQEAKAVKGLFLFHFITGIMINSKYITIKKKKKKIITDVTNGFFSFFNSIGILMSLKTLGVKELNLTNKREFL